MNTKKKFKHQNQKNKSKAEKPWMMIVGIITILLLILNCGCFKSTPNIPSGGGWGTSGGWGNSGGESGGAIPVTYTLTIFTDPEFVTPSVIVTPPGDWYTNNTVLTYADGTIVSINSSDYCEDWFFDSWGGDAEGTFQDSPISLTMDSNKVVWLYYHLPV